MVRLYLVVEVEPEDTSPASDDNAEELGQLVKACLNNEDFLTNDDRDWFVDDVRVEFREAH